MGKARRLKAKRKRAKEAQLAAEPSCQGHPDCPRLAIFWRVVTHPQSGEWIKIFVCDRHKLQLDRIKREDDGAAKAAAQMMAVNFGYDPSQRRWRRLSDIAAEQQAA